MAAPLTVGMISSLSKVDLWVKKLPKILPSALYKILGNKCLKEQQAVSHRLCAMTKGITRKQDLCCLFCVFCLCYLIFT